MLNISPISTKLSECPTPTELNQRSILYEKCCKMELIAKVSKGSRMDQVYIPKHRPGLNVGSYVVVKQLEVLEKVQEKPYYYNIKYIEPIKLEIINKIFNIINKNGIVDNIIITGSFLEKGFNFNDIDIITISNNKIDSKYIENLIKTNIGIKAHLILLSNKAIIEGLATDPLYNLMLSECISKKRLIYKIKKKINYKILDLHLLKSKSLLDNFDILSGKEKYSLTRNMVSISLFIENKKINYEILNKEIRMLLDLKNVDEIKQNRINKKSFLKNYNKIYKKTFNKIMKKIKNGSKQK